jgi:hypothetical protein
MHAPAVPTLFAVAALSPDDVWAAGEEGPGKQPVPVIAHWDGHRLHRYKAFEPSSKKGGSMSAIAAVGPDDIWAAGGDNGTGDPIVVHWDGNNWSRVPLPHFKTQVILADITALAADDVWAVGSSHSLQRVFAMHWDGRRWRATRIGGGIASTPADLRSVDARSGDDVWAVGENTDDRYTTFGYLDVVLHWNGAAWSQVASPLADEVGTGPVAYAVSVAPDGDVWTLDYDYSGNGPYFVRWRGTHRTRTTVYQPTLDRITVEDNVEDVAAVSRANVWGVGSWDYEYDTPYPLVVHWNGKAWRREHPPLEHLKNATLESVSVLAPRDVWAAGEHLIARFSCS